MSEPRYLRLNVTFLKLFAQYPLDPTSNPFYIIIHYIWKFCFLAFLVSFSLQNLITIIVTEGGFMDKSMNFMNLGILTFYKSLNRVFSIFVFIQIFFTPFQAIYVGGFLRVIYYYAKNDIIKGIIEEINETYTYETEEGPYKYTMERVNKMTKILAPIWFMILFGTAELIMVLTLFREEKVLPFPVWFPWDIAQSPYYEISYVYEAFVGLYMGYAYANPDQFYACTTILTAGQFEMLGVDCKNILYKSLVKCGIDPQIALKFDSSYNYYGTTK